MVVANGQSKNSFKGDRRNEIFKRKNIIFAGVFIALVLIILILSLLLIGRSGISYEAMNVSTETIKSHEPETQDPKINSTSSNKLEIISRRNWLAQPPAEEPNKLHLPVPYVIIMHTSSESCKNHADCTFAVRHIQAFHIDGNGWWDIGYNFLIGGDGFAYEGRGWKSEGGHSYGYNARSIGIAFIGTYHTVVPNQAQLTAAKQLIEQGVENGSIAKNYKLLAARQVSSTKSPGLMLYEEIKKWPHWAASP